MEKLRFKNTSDPGRTARGLLFCMFLCLTGAGCQERIEISRSNLRTDEPLAPHPLVERDLPAINDAGVIRLITQYNSSSYFIHRGGQAGFDYELAWRFAREHDLTLEVVIPEPGEDLVSLLNSGRGDLVGAGLVADPDLERWAATTRPTNFVRKILVMPADSRREADFRSLKGMMITLPVIVC